MCIIINFCCYYYHDYYYKYYIPSLGRSGLSLSFVTQFEIGLLQSIEAATGNQKMKESSAVKEEQVIPLLNPVVSGIHVYWKKLIAIFSFQ